MSYRQATGGVFRVADGAFIPADTGNADYQEVLRWLAQGNQLQVELGMPERKARAVARITAARNIALATLTADFDGDTWDADEATAARIANALTMIREAEAIGLLTPASIPWRTADNRDRTLTIDELRAMGAAVFLAQQVVWAKQATLKNRIEAATNPNQVEVVRW